MLAPRAVLAPRVARASRSSADGKQQPSSARTTTTFFQRARATRRRERALHVMRLYPDAGFVAKVQSKFPAQGVASAEEGRCLWDDGYDILDVRAESEIDHAGKCPNPPAPGAAAGTRVTRACLVHAERRYDPELREKVYAQSGVNPSFMADVEKAFQDKNAKIMVVCGDGRTRATRAVELMRAAGYENVVRLEGGFNLWARAWDQTMRRRNLPGSFSRGFDSPMFADSNVTGEVFNVEWKDATEWAV
ncbi:uncharacterized protein MICPUCDRAFT_68025 [Micromonas pusilla CCMP1545]|uniref:Predicted protein n=1 Tax=Micromonas pusilla (strain CCMP1545) TaxID=564608 RepID=C1MT22_MICPC|nr:uncharacterized protein MICPUCDRAFT_68025 [Micromonas pusilla CCMP1545]EEH56873.1 predicted protein [Micromonas pusilla CCMP1545]|eukprot:XP_003058418.1 predicted protein [Micromonas pusilla CCMP1545]